MSSPARHKAWYVALGGIVAAVIGVITLFHEFAWALPWEAATKDDLRHALRTIHRVERKVDMLLLDRGLTYTDPRGGRSHEASTGSAPARAP